MPAFIHAVTLPTQGLLPVGRTTIVATHATNRLYRTHEQLACESVSTAA